MEVGQANMDSTDRFPLAYSIFFFFFPFFSFLAALGLSCCTWDLHCGMWACCPVACLAWEIPWTEELVGYSPWVHKSRI